MGRFKKGEVDEHGNISICVRGHSNAIHELVLPPILMKMLNWKDGDRVEMAQVEVLIDPSSDKTLMELCIMKVDDAKLLYEDENKEREVKSAHDKTR